MNPPMIGFFFGVVVGGAGVILAIGIIFLVKEREKGKNIQKIPNDLDKTSIARSKISEATIFGTNTVLP